MQSSYQVIRVFNKPGKIQGNTAAVINESNYVDLPLDRSKISADMFNNNGIDTTCFISMVTNDHYNVRCFNNKNEIQCCGHGMLAAAKSIFSENEFSNITLNNDVTASRISDHDDIINLNLPRLIAKSQDVPAWAKNFITVNDNNLVADFAAASAESDGYLLLEFDPPISLEEFRILQIDSKIVCENTQRAIVLVQFDETNSHLFMRYFAPQYGVAEDSATGSVMRFVADYIEQRYQAKQFEVNQCSPQGGYMKVDCFSGYIQITANTILEQN